MLKLKLQYPLQLFRKAFSHVAPTASGIVFLSTSKMVRSFRLFILCLKLITSHQPVHLKKTYNPLDLNQDLHTAFVRLKCLKLKFSPDLIFMAHCIILEYHFILKDAWVHYGAKQDEFLLLLFS